MTSTHKGGVRSFRAAAVLDPYRGVKLDANGDVVYAALTDNPIGFTLDFAHTIGDLIAIALRTCPDTVEVRLGGNCNPGDILYQQANGLFSTSSAGSAVACLRAMTAGTSGSTVEAMNHNI